MKSGESAPPAHSKFPVFGPVTSERIAQAYGANVRCLAAARDERLRLAVDGAKIPSPQAAPRPTLDDVLGIVSLNLPDDAA